MAARARNSRIDHLLLPNSMRIGLDYFNTAGKALQPAISTFVFVAVTARCPCTKRVLMHSSPPCLPYGACRFDETCRDAAVRIASDIFGAIPSYKLTEAGFSSCIHGSHHHVTVCFTFDSKELSESFYGAGYTWLDPNILPHDASLTQAVLLKQLSRPS